MGKASRRRAERGTVGRRPGRPDVTLRPLTSDDITVASEILRAGDVLPKDMPRYLGHSPTTENGFAFGTAAVVEGALIGVVVAQGVRLDLAIDLSGGVGLVDGLAVDQAFRGVGIGSLLLEDTVQRFQSLGHRGVIAQLAAGRSELVTFYTRHGWSVGLPGQGAVLATDEGPVAVMENAAARVARLALVYGSRSPFV
ncbi:GNAT family N-acetyltransferase [Streptomyces sp. NBC_01353]|uniref:GNAT family N-acetyltransferase n=1 Tax=Streptomyces sp. NBC_01353 TaxID=2903835 RepID=UPI002E333500|nr:GNAT family N-acetyltransferase [Streptomyces sp. NBC_01353]